MTPTDAASSRTRVPTWLAVLMVVTLPLTGCAREVSAPDPAAPVQLPGRDLISTLTNVGPLEISARRAMVVTPGVVRVILTVVDVREDRPVRGLAIRASAGEPDPAMGTHLVPREERPGRYHFDVPISHAGSWTVEFVIDDPRYRGLEPFIEQIDVEAE